MKLHLILPTCLLLSLSSCGFFPFNTTPQGNPDGSVRSNTVTPGNVIPPPSGQDLSKTAPGISVSPEQPTLSPPSTPNGLAQAQEVNTEQINGFIYKDVLNALPSQRGSTHSASVATSQ